MIGHSEYSGNVNQKVASPAVHKKFRIAKSSNKEELLKHLSLHEQDKTDYMEMSRGLADRGIEKWTFDTIKMTITYYDRDRREMLVEAIT